MPRVIFHGASDQVALLLFLYETIYDSTDAGSARRPTRLRTENVTMLPDTGLPADALHGNPKKALALLDRLDNNRK